MKNEMKEKKYHLRAIKTHEKFNISGYEKGKKALNKLEEEI
ncbi:MAG: hypothetical protein ACTSPQ_13275 [Candidatus Helarchaeota archaeon]